MNTPDIAKASGRRIALRHLRGAGRHFRSNVVAYLALAVAVGSGGSYALAATTSSGTFAVCVDKGSGVMHLAKHTRCGRHQTRIGLSSALDRPAVSAWAAVVGVRWTTWRAAHGAVVTQEGAGLYQSGSPLLAAVMRPITRLWSASTTVSRPRAWAAAPAHFRWRGRRRPALELRRSRSTLGRW